MGKTKEEHAHGGSKRSDKPISVVVASARLAAEWWLASAFSSLRFRIAATVGLADECARREKR